MKKIVMIILSFFVTLAAFFAILFLTMTSAVSKSQETVELEVKSGETYLSIADDLKEENLIKSEFFYKLYIKIFKPNQIQSGKYELNESFSVSEIIEVLKQGSNYNPNIVKLTIPEGKNIKQIAVLISEATTYSAEDIISTIDNQAFVDSVINKYEFITEAIKQEGIKHPLEGYLFPDTYEIDKTKSIETIITKMLDQMEKVIKEYDFSNSKYTIHEILTLASIVELEGKLDDDRKTIAGVFYNRLNIGMQLGSDVTSYYGYGLDITEPITKVALNDVNPYNTRGNVKALPIGPICNSGKASIEATINPNQTDYMYFIANTCDDADNKTYFAITYSEHQKNVNKYLTCE